MKPLDKLHALMDELAISDLIFIRTYRQIMLALIAVARAAIEAGCICDMVQDRPGLSEHSAKCRALRDALAALDKAIEG